jgi:replicative DNA helicase
VLPRRGRHAAQEKRQSAVAGQHGRIPPHDLDAERSLLGGLFLDPLALVDVEAKVAAADFYREAHRKIFEAICALSARTEPYDRVAVKGELGRMGMLEQVGGEEFVDLLDKITPISPNLPYYATRIRGAAARRKMIEAASVVAQLGYEQHGSTAEYLDQAEASIYAAARSETSEQDFAAVKEMLTAAVKRINEGGPGGSFQHQDQ